MGVAERPWRRMRRNDVPAVDGLGGVVHPAFYERPEVFLDRLALFPEGALVCDAPDAAFGIAGYAIAYPAPLAAPPPLDTVLGRLPADADALYIHDVAVDPAFRGRGLSEGAVWRLVDLAEARFAAATLISIYGTPPFWRRFGFEQRPDLIDPEKLASYGGEAVFMLRPCGAQTSSLGPRT
ncbi:GNAT family N-acetyltransferase [Antarcticirhabdus aurantiaca]|uniref:GNAT family N-acetyltransferase n=1 Tax=Antarcticirhabdus aurantiaca TaxID=2606717 RepID=A0ACD4NPR9_9HYPH|nr:GNAT family N-acetyltransferase [Antarcticirhabdus aurantiaca]WAJ28845.1 GNAT family N-acetyltransferase [Jeongeuplla avenae]